MSAQSYPNLPTCMNDPAILEAIAAQDAAEALIALGWPVPPHGSDMDAWIIGDLIWTDIELVGLAARQEVQRGSERAH